MGGRGRREEGGGTIMRKVSKKGRKEGGKEGREGRRKGRRGSQEEGRREGGGGRQGLALKGFLPFTITWQPLG